MKRDKDYFRGCLLGGAIGDALGAPIKTMKYEEIIKKYGENGLSRFDIVNIKEKATITDDTQRTLFTAEGLIRSEVRARQKRIERNNRDTSIIIFRAYLRWLYTQGLSMPNWNEKSYDGWLVRLKDLYRYREVDITCITALGKGIMGTPKKPINQSRRAEAVIRVAPIGLFEQEESVFEVGKLSGAITHGAPEAYISAAALATLIFYIIEGKELEKAVERMLDRLKEEDGAIECIVNIEKAIQLAKDKPGSIEYMHQLGSGFMGDEILGMAIYCALSYLDNFEKGLALAINHSGNSNGVAAVYGNIIGAYRGEKAIDEEYLNKVELRKEITQVADDLWMRYEEGDYFKSKYPGW